MTIARLSASPLYVQRVLRPEVSANPNISLFQVPHYQNFLEPRRLSSVETIVEWFVPFLTILGTAAAMWFVIADGSFQLCALWGL